MKRSFLLLLIIICGITSCDKQFLTRDHPTATTDENFWKTEAQLLSVIQYMAAAMPTGAFQYNQNTRISFSALTDEAVWTANFFPELNTIPLGNASPNMPRSDYMAIFPLWREDYKRIRVANRFLEHAGGAYVDTNDLKRYMLEARAFRAWFHLELLLYYGPVPLVTGAVTPEEADLARNSKEEIIDFVTSELTECAAGLPLEYPGDQPYRITKGAALTMKAVAYLNAGRYPEAAAAAREVIDLGYYELFKSANPQDSYLKLFMYAGEKNKERILSNQSQQGAFYRCGPPNVGGTSNVNPSAAIVNAYETKQGKTIPELGPDSVAIYKKNPNYSDNRDPRLKASVIYPGVVFYSLVDPFNSSPSNSTRLGAINSSRTGYWQRKYVDLADRAKPSQGNLDFMIFRYADVLLMYVEALVESGHWDHPDVVKYLNMIRNRAGMPDVDVSVYNNEAKMRELYRRERQVELAFEGSRWFDIRRWKIAEQVMNGTVEGATNPATGQTVIVETRSFNPGRDYLWPIPGQEIQGNPNMTQNPEY